jgi:hypothetical protein
LRLLRGIAEEAAPMIDKRLSGARKKSFFGPKLKVVVAEVL